MGIKPTIEQPFDVFQSVLQVEVDLEDANKNLVFPVKITGIKALDRQKQILGAVGKFLKRTDLITEDLDTEIV